MTPPDLTDEQIEELRELLSVHNWLKVETVNALCDMALRVRGLEQLADIGRQWNENSSLEKWFPFTAEHLDGLKRENAALRLAINTANERAEASAKDAGRYQFLRSHCHTANAPRSERKKRA